MGELHLPDWAPLEPKIEMNLPPAIAIEFSYWDGLLLIAVALMGTAIAYLPNPKWKAFVLTLPIPFTLATLSLGQRVNVTNVLGLILLLLYTTLVRVLHYRVRIPILPAIALSALMYCVLGSAVNGSAARSEVVFWSAVGLTALVALWAQRHLPAPVEDPHRSPLPLWIKFPAICGVVLFLILIKKQMAGAMTVFPMVGVIASYEGRRCLYTLNRQIPILMLALLALIVPAHVLYPWLGLTGSLLVGWLAFAPVLWTVWRKAKAG